MGNPSTVCWTGKRANANVDVNARRVKPGAVNQLYPGLTAPSLEQAGQARETLMLECWRLESDVLMGAARGAKYATERRGLDEDGA